MHRWRLKAWTVTTPKNLPVNTIWTPEKGICLIDQTPSPEELVNLWQKYSETDTESIKLTDGIYGVYSLPNAEVKAVASIDLCEVLRKTGSTFHELIGEKPTGYIDYLEKTWASAKIYEYQLGRNVLETLIGHAASQGLIPAIENSQEISEIIKNWRQNDVYIIANTSTLEGSEKGTIIHTLGRDYPGLFDAIVFPRNYDGNGPTTKAEAIKILTDQAGIDLNNIPIIHIDDMPHHIKSFNAWRSESGLDITTFMPTYMDNLHVNETTYHDTALNAFEVADETLRDKGIINE